MKSHCDLCDHQKLSLMDGSICSLTNRKPDFNRPCIKANFNRKLKNKINEIITELEYLKYSKKNTYSNSILRLLIGFIVLLIGTVFIKFFFIKIYEISGYYSKFSTLILGLPIVVGYYFVKYSTLRIKKHKKAVKYFENEKAQIDEVLTLYNKRYNYIVDFDQEVHGIQEVYLDIKIL